MRFCGLTFTGAQVESFEAPLIVEGLRDPEHLYTGVFIRAPVRNYQAHIHHFI